MPCMFQVPIYLHCQHLSLSISSSPTPHTCLFVFPLKAFRVLVFTSFEIFCFPLGKMHPSGHQQRSEMSSAFPSLSSSSGPVPGCFQLPPGGEKFKLENFVLFHLFV